MENNGNWKVKVDEFRGYVRGKIEDLAKMNEVQNKDMKEMKTVLGELKEAFITRPQDCPISKNVKKLDKKIDSVEEFVSNQKAVKKYKVAFWGIFSGIIGTIITLLTYVLLIAKTS